MLFLLLFFIRFFNKNRIAQSQKMLFFCLKINF